MTAWSTRTTPIVVDERSTAAVLIDRLERVRPRRNVVRVNALMAAQSAQAFLDEVLAGRLLHAGHEALDRAVAGARRRPIGDAGGWGFDRRDEMVAIAPVVAASLARYGAAAHGRRPSKPGRIGDPELRGSGIHRCWMNNGRLGGGQLKATSRRAISVVPQTPTHDQSE